jgi:hypothetical protein
MEGGGGGGIDESVGRRGDDESVDVRTGIKTKKARRASRHGRGRFRVVDG